MKRWKIAFFALLIIFFAFIVTLVALFDHYLPPAKETDFTVQQKVSPNEPIFTVSTTKQQLQALINDKLQEYNGKKNLHYQVEMQDDLIFKGTLTLLGNDIEFVMELTPIVVDNGNLMLKEHSIRLGLFNLPVSRVLQYVKNSAVLPDWVTILPDQEEVYVALQDISIEDQFYLRAREFDLHKNRIRFSVYALPAEQK